MVTVTTSSIQEKSYSQDDWKRGYESQLGEYSYGIEEIEGQIPLDLEGTLFRNGPGALDVHGTPVRHPFDGDGMVVAIALKEGKAYFKNSFVKTKEFIEEKKAGKMLYRGVFGSQKPGGIFNNIFDLRLKNIANTNVIYWGNKLLALWEAAQPYRLDPSNLDTMGIDDLDGILKGGESFSAHPWVDPSCAMDEDQPCLVNFSIQPGLKTKLNIFEIAPSGKLLRRHTHEIKGFAFIHDFAITPNYCIFFQNPVSYNPFPFLFGLKGAGECITFHEDQPTSIIVIPRKPPYDNIKVLKGKAGFIFHHGNAFEKDDHTLCIDSVSYGKLSQINPDSDFREVDFSALSPGQLWRFTLDLETEKVDKEMIDSWCVEFPVINPAKVGRDYRYVYIGATHNPDINAPLQGLLKLDLLTKEKQFYSFAPKGFAGEPIFVPKPNASKEDEGWVLVLMYDSQEHRSKLMIFDAENITQGAIATLKLNHHIPYGLHGNWTSEVFI
jgi:all-trans-8'-apo-beta-carotenal 15,15'-oxygenase